MIGRKCHHGIIKDVHRPARGDRGVFSMVCHEGCAPCASIDLQAVELPVLAGHELWRVVERKHPVSLV